MKSADPWADLAATADKTIAVPLVPANVHSASRYAVLHETLRCTVDARAFVCLTFSRTHAFQLRERAATRVVPVSLLFFPLPSSLLRRVSSFSSVVLVVIVLVVMVVLLPRITFCSSFYLHLKQRMVSIRLSCKPISAHVYHSKEVTLSHECHGENRMVCR